MLAVVSGMARAVMQVIVDDADADERPSVFNGIILRMQSWDRRNGVERRLKRRLEFLR